METNSRLASLATALDDAEVTYCVWKSQHKLAKVEAGSEDADLLVAIEDRHTLIGVLQSSGYVQVDGEWHTRDIGTAMYSGLGPDGVAVKVHVHSRVLFGNSFRRGYSLPVGPEVLERRVRDGRTGMWVADPYSDLCLFLTRHLVRSKAGVPVKFSSEWSELLRHHQESEFRDTDAWYPIAEVSNVVANRVELLPDLRGLRRSVKRQMQTFRSRRSPARTALAASDIGLTTILRKAGLRKRKPAVFAEGGFIVPFTGIDGAGKSSALERLSEDLGANVPVATIFLGSGQSGASLPRRLAFRLLGTKARFAGHSDARDRSAEKKEGRPAKKYPWYYQLWLLLCLHDKRSNLRRGLSLAAEGHLVLADRWPQSQDPNAADGPRTENMVISNALDRYTQSVERRLIAEVEMVRVPLLVLLDVSPEMSVERKPDDLTLEQATAGRARLRSIEWNADRVALVDADDSIERVDQHVLESIREVVKGR